MGGDLESGTLVAGRYRIVGPLGKGGSGETYVAEHVNGGTVALKRFKLKGAASWKSLELFEREGRVLAGLEHPCIPRYIESFSVDGREGPEHYLAQTLAPGQSMAEWVASGARVSESVAKQMAEELLVVLRYLHGLTPPVIHRDLKPANVIIGPEGRLALVDFGAVKDAPADSQVGGTTVVGTYGFMAPEQFRGVASPASDLYGLGATLVFLLTHRSPDQLPQKKLRIQLPKDLGLSSSFSAWLGRVLEPAPEDRFQSAEAALVALRSGRLPNGGSSRRTAILAAILAVLVALAGGGVFFIQKRLHENASAPRAVEPAAAKPLYLPEPNRRRLFALRPWKSLPAHVAGVNMADITADGTRVITGSSDRTAKIWSTDTWEPLHTLTAHTDSVRAATFTPDGKGAVTGGDTTVRTWDVATGTAQGSVDVGARISTLDVSDAGDLVVVAAEDGKVRAYQLPSLKPLWTADHQMGKGRVITVDISSNGKLVASGGDDRTVRLWSATDGAPAGSRSRHGATIDTVRFVPGDNQLISTADDGQRILWDIIRPEPLSIVRESASELWSAAIDPGGKFVFTADDHGTLTVRSFLTMSLLLRWERPGAGGTVFMRTSRDGKRLLIGNRARTLDVYALPEPEAPDSLPIPPENLPEDLPPRPDAATPARRASVMIDSYAGNRSVLNEASTIVQKALADNPNDALAMVEAARIEESLGMRNDTSYDQGRLDKAFQLVDAAIKLAPRLYEAHYARGWLLLQRAKSTRKPDGPPPALDEARQEADLAASLDPTKIGPAALRANIAMAEGNSEEALQQSVRLLQAAKTRDDVLIAYSDLATAYQALGRYDAAETIYRRQVALDAKSAWRKGNFASFLIARGKPGDAITMAEDAISIMNYPAAHDILAEAWTDAGITALWDYGDAAKARTDFEAALKENRRHADALYGIVAVDAFEATSAGKPCTSCAEKLQAVLASDPKHAQAKAAMAQLKTP